MTEDIDLSAARPKGRSPAYPGISLPEAIEKTRLLLKAESTHWTALPAIATAIGYKSETSGSFAVAYSAIKKFGLVEEQGSKASRQGRVSRLGQQILLAPDPADFVRQAALTPPIHQEMWDRFKLDLPSDQSLIYTLRMDKAFTESGAQDFVKQYRETLQFGVPSEGISDDDEGVPEDPDESGKDDLGGTEGSDRGQTGTGGPSGDNQNGRFPPPGSNINPPPPGVTRIPLPLAGGDQVSIEGAFPISEAAWDHLLALLTAFKPGLTHPND